MFQHCNHLILHLLALVGLSSLCDPCLFSIIAPPRHLSRRLIGLHPQFPIGRLTSLRRIRVSPPPSLHFDSSSSSLGSPSGSTPGSPPVTFTMPSLGPNAGGSPGPNAGNTTSGTVTGTTSATPLLPYMAGLSLPDFN